MVTFLGRLVIRGSLCLLLGQMRSLKKGCSRNSQIEEKIRRFFLSAFSCTTEQAGWEAEFPLLKMFTNRQSLRQRPHVPFRSADETEIGERSIRSRGNDYRCRSIDR